MIRDLLYAKDPYADAPVVELDAQGWSANYDIFEQVLREFKPKTLIEVGSWKGASAIAMAKILSEIHDDFEILCVDTFLASYEHWTGIAPHLDKQRFINGRPDLYEKFLSNVNRMGMARHITPFPIDSVNAYHTLKYYGVQADFVYVDAGHEYESVKQDLIMYADLLRKGGVLLGDDYFHPPIKQAVEEVFGQVLDNGADKFLWIKP